MILEPFVNVFGKLSEWKTFIETKEENDFGFEFFCWKLLVALVWLDSN